MRSDHPCNSRQGGACIYYSQPLAFNILDIKYLQECIVFQVLIANKLCNFIFLYRSPSQPTDIFHQFADKLESLTTQFGLQQIIKGPTHILAETSFCIDLIFTSHQNLVMESGVRSSLYPNCHHHITYAKFNLKIHHPPPCEREIWHYD